MDWLKRLKPPKFYRYMFYQMHLLFTRLKNDPPELSASLLMSLTIFFQFHAVVLGLSAWANYDLWNNFFAGTSFLQKAAYVLIFGCICYFLFYYKSKWKSFLKEFEVQGEEKPRIQKIQLFVYIVISFGCLYLSAYFASLTSPYILR